MNRLYLDCETRSHLDLTEVGLDRYVRDSSTQMLMLAYALNENPVEVWEPRLGRMPEELAAHLPKPDTKKVAWNVPFEFNIFTYVLQIPVQLIQFHDAMVQARYLALPGSLGDCGAVLGLAETAAKMKDGKRLVKLFGQRSKSLKKQLAAGAPPLYFKDWDSDPEDWASFVAYCARDVESMRTIGHRLDSFGTLPPSEYKLWVLDQKINHRGFSVDMPFVNNSASIAEIETTKRLQE